MKENEEKRRVAREKGVTITSKRLPAQPRKGHFVRTKGKEAEIVEILPYEFTA